MVTNGNQTYCVDHFIKHTNIKSLCYSTTETNIMLYVNYTSIKKKKKQIHNFYRVSGSILVKNFFHSQASHTEQYCPKMITFTPFPIIC